MSTTIMTCPVCGKTDGIILKGVPCPKCANASAPHALPDSFSAAKHYAKQWVRHLMARGYTCERIDREVYMGYSGPGEAGYSVSHGKIMIDNWHSQNREKWTFSFRQLAGELNQPEQTMLF